MKRKFLAGFLVICMLFSILPGAAFAEIAEGDDELGAPTNLQWIDNKGNISWNAVDGVERYDVVVKKDGIVVRNMQCRDREGTGVCTASVADMINESGEYTFSVATIVDGARGTYIQCQDSFQYVRPTEELSAPESPQWRDGFASWKPNTETDKLNRYDVHFYKEQSHASGHGYNGLVRADGYMYDIMHYVDDIIDRFNEEPDAKLTFSVQAISNDISTVANSPIVNSENTVKIGDYLGELSAPTGLEWHKDRDSEKTATLVFYPTANTYDYHVKLYCNDSLVHEADFSETGFYTGGKTGVDLSSKITQAGIYTAEVCALGNDNTTFDSDYTMCAETFERREAMAAPTNVKWLDKSRGIIGWEGPENHGGFELIVMRNDGTVGRMGFGGGMLPDGDGFYTAYTGNLINRSGDYTVSVRTWSYNDTLEDSDYVVSDVFEYTRPANELLAPQNLQWRDHFATWEEIDDENLTSYSVYYHRNGSTVMYDTVTPLTVNERGYISHNDNSFALNALLKKGNDNYTFVVQANSSDLLNVANSSSSAVSAELNESAFRGKLDIPSGLEWSTETLGLLEFYPVANTMNDQSRAYHIQLYRDNDLILDADHGFGYNDANGKIWMYLGDYMTESGVYTVKLCVNGDGDYSTNSDYATSAPLRKDINITAILENLNDQNNMTVDETIAVVKGIDSEELMNAMSSDKNSISVAKEIAELEEKYDLTAIVEVNHDSGVSIDASKVSVVGAGLNAKDVSEAPKFTITKLSTTKQLPKEYAKNVQLEFTLSNVATDSQNNLAVPVQVTIPVPNDINPQKFHILHYKTQGGIDVIEPHVFKESNVWFARFTVNSFSPFVFAELAEEKVQTTAMYRLYNPNSGEHFYTGSIEERDMLDSVGWNYEGIAWNAPTQSGEPVYRLFNPNSGDHHYTMSAEERDMLVYVGWNYEGVAWNSASNNNVPQYRLYNPNADCGSHHYTSSTEERDFLVSLGWILEGIGWFGMLN